jgi:hypothetical protein
MDTNVSRHNTTAKAGTSAIAGTVVTEGIKKEKINNFKLAKLHEIS